MLNYWKTQYIDKGFNPGGMLARDNFCYVPIPKNSSSYISDLLEINNWEIYNFLDYNFQDKSCIILLRDPVDRWITGISQYLCSQILGPSYRALDVINEWSPLVEKIIFDRIIFDDHTEKQMYFIETMPMHKCIFINSSDEPELKIKKYLGSYGIDLNIKVDVDKNESLSSYDHSNFVKFFKDLLRSQPHLITRIKDVYKQDYELIKQVRFYD
jgi:hypothetical protein